MQNNYPATRFICYNFEIKRYINDRKVQVADENKRGICVYLVLSDVADDAWYDMCNTFLYLQIIHQATPIICHNFEIKRYIINQKVLVAD